jgi:hypothetical protein
MAKKRKEGWARDLGTFSHDDNSLPITNKSAQNEDGPGKSYADQVYSEDYPVRGVRKGFS